MKKITKKQIWEILEQVIDPELNISIIDLGLVYNVFVKTTNTKQNKSPQVRIVMTLTTIGCPLVSVIEQEIKNKLSTLGISHDNIKVELTFDPPWSMERMSAKAKALLGI